MTALIIATVAVVAAGFAWSRRSDSESERPGRRSAATRRRPPPFAQRSPAPASTAQTAQIPVDIGGHVQHIRERRAERHDRRMGVGLASELWESSGLPDRRQRNRGRRTRDMH